jgi:hypothetical protein
LYSDSEVVNVSEQFEPEVKKFRWLLSQGYITPQELAFYSNFYEIQMTSIVNFEGSEILTPLFILARPSRFDQIKRELPQAEIADPISRKFPVISLLSLEKFINSLANMKIPYFFFSLFLDKSYNLPQEVNRFLSILIELANSSGKYVIKPYNIKIEPLPLNIESVPVKDELYKVICHFRKMLGNKVECNDDGWWKYNLWGNRNTASTSTVDRKLIEKLALQYNISPICIHYVLLYNKNPCHLSSDIINKIKSHLSS